MIRFNKSLVVLSLLFTLLLAPALPGEERGVWIHSRMFGNVEEEAARKMEELFSQYAEIGISDLYCFNSMMDQHKMSWDFLDVLLKRAHARGIRVHPILFPGHRQRLEGEIKEHPEWLIRGRKGEIHPHLNLANPEVKEYVLKKVDRLLKYDIDGIHLDYIRFPAGQCFSFDKDTCNAFKKEYGYSPLEVIQDCGSMFWSRWILWNADHVTELVGRAKELIEESGKDIPLSAAVFPDCDTARVMIGQDWARWAEEGIIDVLCPMLYTNDLDLFERFAGKARAAVGDHCRLFAGIAIKSSHNENTPEGVSAEVKRARRAGADGVVFFSGYSLSEDVMTALSSTVFRQ